MACGLHGSARLIAFAPRDQGLPQSEPAEIWTFYERRGDDAAATYCGTDGRALFAIGDVHGRIDLLHEMIKAIEHDIATSDDCDRPHLVFLGDYIDRGAQSREVIDALIALQSRSDLETTFLIGNHEAFCLKFIQDARIGPMWARHGGLETLQSYGVSLIQHGHDWTRARDAFLHHLPSAHLAFLLALKPMAAFADYVFVHAGVRPGVALDAQEIKDLLWIREGFLDRRVDCGKTVVHGHTPVTRPELKDGRIGIDSGAYMTGNLSAVKLTDHDVEFIIVGRRPERYAVAPAERASLAS